MIRRLTQTVFWRIDRKNRLHLFGFGRVPGYPPNLEYLRKLPWEEYEIAGVVIGRWITEIHPTVLFDISLDAVALAKNQFRKRLELTDSGLYNNQTKELVRARDQMRVCIREGTESIHAYAFAYQKNVKEIECPASLKRIGNSAFEGCEQLRAVYRIPDGTILGRNAMQNTSGVRLYRESYLLKAKLSHFHPKYAITEHGRGFLMNGEFVFYAAPNVINIDPTKFYRCRDLIDIKGGKDFIIGLRANGKVVYEEAGDWSDLFGQLQGWQHIRQIDASGDMAVGLSEEGKVYSTHAEYVDEPLSELNDIISVEIKNGKIYAVKDDWTVMQI